MDRSKTEIGTRVVVGARYGDGTKPDVLPPEEWKDITGFEGMYQASTYGRIRSLDRYSDRNGRLIKGKIMKGTTDKDGYLKTTFYKGGKNYYFRIHRLVALTFIPNPENKPVIDHIDPTNKANNCVWNLQWVSSADNLLKYYAEESGLDKPLSALTKEDFDYMGKLYNQGLSYDDIAKKMGLGIKSTDTIWAVLSGDRLSSVSGFKRGDFKMRPHPVQKLSDEDIMQLLKERLIDKDSGRVVSEKWGIAQSMVSRYCKGIRRPEIYAKFVEQHPNVLK